MPYLTGGVFGPGTAYVTEEMQVRKSSGEEPRDDHGRWSSAGGGAGIGATTRGKTVHGTAHPSNKEMPNPKSGPSSMRAHREKHFKDFAALDHVDAATIHEHHAAGGGKNAEAHRAAAEFHHAAAKALPTRKPTAGEKAIMSGPGWKK